MKSTTMNLIVVAALFFGSAALAADEEENATQPAETGTEVTVSAEETEGLAQPAETKAAVSAEPVTTTGLASPSLAEESKPSPKRTNIQGYKQTTAVRPKNLDLRYCLELENNIEIAKCAGE